MSYRRLVQPRHIERNELNDPRFGARMTGTGEIARQIGEVFHLFGRRYGLDGDLPDYDCSRFRPLLPKTGQLRLF